jgi:predicted dehydrogenase
MTLGMGLVGAGPWARVFHAPMLAAGPATTLAAVWARRAEAAQAIVADHGGVVAASFNELLDACDAVAFAVPPDVQAELAPQAAARGKHLLLEKPLAFSLPDAERIVEAVDNAGVQSVLMLRNRFTQAGRTFVDTVRTRQPLGSQARFISSATLPGNLFATPWRVQRGALLDVGPHVLDLLDAAMGSIERVTAIGDPLTWVCLITEHHSGILGQAALSVTAPAVNVFQCDVFTDRGLVRFDGSQADQEGEVMTAITAALADAVRTGKPHPVNVHRGLQLQRLIADAESSIAATR